VESSCKCCNEPSGSIKMVGNFQAATQLMASLVVLVVLVAENTRIIFSCR
jgi:hypothetical protein